MLWMWIAVSIAAEGRDALLERADAAWRAGAGQEQILRSQGAHRAAKVWGVGPESFTADSQFGEPTQRQLLLRLEQPLSLGLAAKSWRRANAVHQNAVEEEARWAWISDVHQAWMSWWVTSELQEHLEARILSIDAERERFADAVEAGLLAPADHADLVAESLLVQTELAGVQRQARVTAAQLATLLGPGPYPAGPELDQARKQQQNPWLPLLEAAAHFPSVRAAEELAEAESRRARVINRSQRPTVGAGIMWAPDDTDAMRPFANVGLTIPLRTGLQSERRVAVGEAKAAAARASWTTQQLSSALDAEKERWDAIHAQLSQLQDTVLQPLRDREARLLDAQRAGLTSMDRLVRARRDRHEAEHQALLLSGELLQSTSRAALLRQMVETP